MTHRIQTGTGPGGRHAGVILLSLLASACGGGAGGGESTPVSGVGTARLSWTPPTTNSDGTALNDLAGYRIYHGTESGSYPDRITVSNPGLSSYDVQNLASGTHFFVVRAYDYSGNESVDSNIASKIIP